MIVEITTYKTTKNTTLEELLIASGKFNKDYCSRCQGLISRQFLKTNEGYMDIFVWRSQEDIERTQKTFMTDKDALKYAKMIDSSTLTITNYELLESFHFDN